MEEDNLPSGKSERRLIKALCFLCLCFLLHQCALETLWQKINWSNMQGLGVGGGWHIVLPVWTFDKRVEENKGSHTRTARKRNQRQSDGAGAWQITQQCLLTDLFIKNTRLTLGNYAGSQNTLAPLGNMFHYHITHGWKDSEFYGSRPVSPHSFGSGVVLLKWHNKKSKHFSVPAPLVGFLHPHLRGDRRTPGHPLLSNTARMPAGG